MKQIALFLVAEGFAVGDEELKVAGVGGIDVRIIDLVDDAVAEREPDAGTAVIRSANAVLDAGRPRGSMPGAPKAMDLLSDVFIGPSTERATASQSWPPSETPLPAFLPARAGRWLFSHLPAFVGALVTGLGALLAMFLLVFGAFVAARRANLGTDRAELRGMC